MLWIDGFDHYGTGSAIFTNINRTNCFASGTSVSWSTDTGRSGTGTAINIGTGVHLTSPIFTSSNSFATGFAFAFLTSVDSTLCSFMNGSFEQLKLKKNVNNILYVQNSSGTTLATGITPLKPTVDIAFTTVFWYFIEFKANDNTFEVRINNKTEMIGNASLSDDTNSVRITGNSLIDDWYITNNDFLGEIIVETKSPIANSTSTGHWTANTGTKFGAIDETTPDNDTTYVSTNTGNAKETFDYTSISTITNIHGINIATSHRQESLTTIRKIGNVIRFNSTDYDLDTETSGTTYAYLNSVANNNPEDNPWTVVDFNASEFGFILLPDANNFIVGNGGFNLSGTAPSI